MTLETDSGFADDLLIRNVLLRWWTHLLVTHFGFKEIGIEDITTHRSKLF